MSDRSPWLPYHRPRPGARFRLFCFPYAGAGASLFNGWDQALGAGIDLCAVQLPGRENRLAEPPFDRIEPLVDAVARGIGDRLDLPYALFGHSMGARIAFELARRVRGAGAPRPFHLFVSGCRGPRLPRSEPPVHALADEAFVRELRRLNGVPPAILEDRELRELFLPILRADFAVVETYRYRDEPPLDCPITAFGGSSDPKASPEELRAWASMTQRAFAAHLFEGDHFFLIPQKPRVLERIASTLDDALRAGGAD